MPTLSDGAAVFPDVPVIDRPGIISAWDDPKFVAAMEKADRKNLIMAGVTIGVCLAFAAMEAVEAGYVYGTELPRDWRLPTGQDLGRVFHDHYHGYGLIYTQQP